MFGMVLVIVWGLISKRDVRLSDGFKNDKETGGDGDNDGGERAILVSLN